MRKRIAITLACLILMLLALTSSDPDIQYFSVVSLFLMFIATGW